MSLDQGKVFSSIKIKPKALLLPILVKDDMEEFFQPRGLSDKDFTHVSRDIGNNFGPFSVPFPEDRISYIRAACNYSTRNANFKRRFSDIRLKSVSFLVSQFVCLS